MLMAMRVSLDFQPGEVMKAAMQRAGLTLEALASAMEITPQAVQQQTSGERPVNWARLLFAATTPVGRDFWKEFWPAIAQIVGVRPNEELVIAEMERTFRASMEQVRTQLRSSDGGRLQ